MPQNLQRSESHPMTILCGTDFSENAGSAARVAAAIAKRLALPLELVHVLDVTGADVGVRHDVAHEPLRARLHADAEELRTRFGVDVEPLAELGAPDEKLVALATDLNARLLVVGSLGARKQRRWLLGSVAERVAQSSAVPVLVVRDAANVEAWARGERTLRVMVGVEQTPPSKVALEWAHGLRAVGPCELTVAQIVWPAEEHRRRGIPSPIPLDHLQPALERSLLRELEQWAGVRPGPGETSFTVQPGWGRVDSHLTQLAADSKMDLLVVGTHQRAYIARLWQGSVSRSVLHGAPMSVACIPSGRVVEDEAGADGKPQDGDTPE